MVKILQQNGQDTYNIITYLADTETDRQNLTVNKYPMGTKIYIIESKKWYILNNSKEWQPYINKKGGI